MRSLHALHVSAAVLAAAVAGALSVVVVATPAHAARPNFQMPFRCGQTWTGATYSSHNPRRSVDFNRDGDFGDAVLASAGGTVTRAEHEGNTSYGLWIEIGHGDGWRTRYAHLSGELVWVGMTVSKGQQIGTLGNSGGSTGPHLHYEQRYNGSAVSVKFDGSTIYYYGKRNYTSKNRCTGAHKGRVNTAGASLSVRRGPSTSYNKFGSVPDGGTIWIICQRRGQTISGTYGTSDWWDKVGAGYVADAYVYTGSDGRVAPLC